MNQNKHKFKMTPGYITGLTQTDGSISCSIIINKNGLISFIPIFNITADLTSKYVLEKINKNHKDIKNQKKIVKMILSMNKFTSRKPERINKIYDALGILNGNKLPLIENINKTIDTPITNDNI